MFVYDRSMNFSRELLSLPGKTNKDNANEYLPVFMHLLDTEGTIRHLVDHWLPESIRKTVCEELSDGEFEKVCRFLALTHDMGKFTPVFVSRILAELPEIKENIEAIGWKIPLLSDFMNPEKSPHALAGAAFLQSKNCTPGIVTVVSAHHGKPLTLSNYNDLDLQMESYFYNYYGTTDKKDDNAQKWMDVREEWFKFALKKAGYASEGDLPNLGMPAQVLLTGLLIMADWISSNTSYFPLISTDTPDFQDIYPARVERAWRKLHFPDSWSSSCFFMDYDIFQNRFGFQPNEVQQAVIKAVEDTFQPGIFILEAQMGVGKTEAALAASELLAAKTGCGGLYFGLPTQATANGIFPRLKQWAEQQSEASVHAIRLAHGMASLNEDYRALFQGNAVTGEDEKFSDLIVHSWFEGRKQALLANFVIGTVDQLLMAALKQKHVMLRHLGLAGKVVIIDECHAYDAYMNQYLDRTLTWLGKYGVPVILLSATLPARRRTKLVEAYLGHQIENNDDMWKTCRDYPLLTWTDGDEVHKSAITLKNTSSRKVAVCHLPDEQIVDCLKNSLSEGGCAGIIVNTVRRAQEISSMLRRELPDKEIVVAHSHFLLPDRAEKEAMLLKRLGKKSTPEQRNGLIVVGTQVLEQSLDVDFDLMLTDLCPMDLLLQRIGRLHRHAGRKRPSMLEKARCMILGTSGEELESGAKAVYGEWLLLRTRMLIPPEIVLPDSIPELVQNTYEVPQEVLEPGSALYTAQLNYQKDINKKEHRAKTYRIGNPRKKCIDFPKLDTIAGWLDTDIDVDDRKAEASVRDGDPSINVLVMMQHQDGQIGFLPWQHGGRSVSANHVPSAEDGRNIAQQQMRLPHVFCVGKLADQAIKELEQRNYWLAEWQQSSWLHGELVLLLNEYFQTDLCGYTLTYSWEDGLTYKKEESEEYDNGSA